MIEKNTTAKEAYMNALASLSEIDGVLSDISSEVNEEDFRKGDLEQAMFNADKAADLCGELKKHIQAAQDLAKKKDETLDETEHPPAKVKKGKK